MAYALLLAREVRLDRGVTITGVRQLADGFSITAVHLTVRAKIPGADAEAFRKAAEGAKAGCPVSKVLNAAITMDAALA